MYATGVVFSVSPKAWATAQVMAPSTTSASACLIAHLPLELPPSALRRLPARSPLPTRAPLPRFPLLREPTRASSSNRQNHSDGCRKPDLIRAVTLRDTTEALLEVSR